MSNKEFKKVYMSRQDYVLEPLSNEEYEIISKIKASDVFKYNSIFYFSLILFLANVLAAGTGLYPVVSIYFCVFYVLSLSLLPTSVFIKSKASVEILKREFNTLSAFKTFFRSTDNPFEIANLADLKSPGDSYSVELVDKIKTIGRPILNFEVILLNHLAEYPPRDKSIAIVN